jgi:hypothetical protein
MNTCEYCGEQTRRKKNRIIAYRKKVFGALFDDNGPRVTTGAHRKSKMICKGCEDFFKLCDKNISASEYYEMSSGQQVWKFKMEWKNEV